MSIEDADDRARRAAERTAPAVIHHYLTQRGFKPTSSQDGASIWYYQHGQLRLYTCRDGVRYGSAPPISFTEVCHLILIDRRDPECDRGIISGRLIDIIGGHPIAPHTIPPGTRITFLHRDALIDGATRFGVIEDVKNHQERTVYQVYFPLWERSALYHSHTWILARDIVEIEGC